MLFSFKTNVGFSTLTNVIFSVILAAENNLGIGQGLAKRQGLASPWRGASEHVAEGRLLVAYD